MSPLAGFGQWVRLPVVVEQIERLDLEVAQCFGGTAGLGEQESLGEVATHVAQDLALLPALDALGHDLYVQAARHGDDGAHDGVVRRVGRDVAYEAAVDLE